MGEIEDFVAKLASKQHFVREYMFNNKHVTYVTDIYVTKH